MDWLNEKTREWKDNTPIAIALIAVFCFLLFALPLIISGMPSGFDMITNIRFATAYQEALMAGQFLPSWADDNFGYGSIGIRFYPPVSAFLLALTHFITNDWFSAFVVNLYVWMVVGCIGIYLFVKEWSSPAQGLLAAILYALVPQHLAEIFDYFVFAQFATWGILPFCFLYVARICRGGTWLDTVMFAISYSVLVLTHLPTTVIVSLCMPIYVLGLIDRRNFRRVLVRLSSAIALVLLATAFRWVTLVSELSWIAHSGPEHYASGYYDFKLWLFPNVFGSGSVLHYMMTTWLLDVVIVLTLALLVPAFICLIRWKTVSDTPLRKVMVASTATALFAFFMLSWASSYIWENVVLIQKLQFPWRWLSVMSVMSVVLFSLSLQPLLERFRKYKRLVAYPSLALIVAIALFDITQVIVPASLLPSADFTEMEARIEREQIWKGWWPTWAKEQAFENEERVGGDGRAIEVAKWHLESKEFVVGPGQATDVRVTSFYYPHWKATVNDRPTEIGMDENGAITIPVAGDASKVRLHFEEPSIINAAHWVSLFTWLTPFGLMLFVYARRYAGWAGRNPLLQEEYDYS